MSETGEYVIGLDLGNEYAQLSFVTFDKEEGDVYDIPVCICKRNGANQWFYGKEAQKFAASGKGSLVEGLLYAALKEEVLEIDGQETDALDLLILFIRDCLSQLGVYKEHGKIRVLVISVNYLTPEMVSLLEKVKSAFKEIEEFFFEQKVESLFYYTINQPKELWSYEVGVIDFSEMYLKTYRVEMNHKSRPIVTTIDLKEYTEIGIPEEFSSIMEKDRYLEVLDETVCEVMEGFLEGHIVTSIYLTGKIFEKEWCKKTLKLICRNRRVFSGSNLYSKGACLSGMERIAPGENARAYLYLGREKLKVNIGVLRMEQGKTVRKILLDGGTNWFEADAEFTFMPGEDMHLPIVLAPLDGRRERVVPVILPEIKGREPKSLRFKCRLSMKTEDELSVVIEDIGLGMFYKADGKKYEEIISLGGNL